MANILPSPTTPQSTGKLRGSYFCYFLAALVMLATAWFILEGIQATEPDSPARHAKVASGILLLFLEGCVFSLAGQFQEHAFILRLLGWSIFVLQITLMTLANYSIGAAAGKAAALKTATVAEIQAQADADRRAAQTLQNAADKLNKSRHSWLNSQGGEKASEAAQKTASAAEAADKLSKIEVSAPIVDKIGETGLLVLSCFWSLVLELSGIALMHVAGNLRREAAATAGGLSVEHQILSVVQEIRGSAPHLQALQNAQDAPHQLPPSPTPTPAVKPALAGPTYSSWATGKGIPLATFGALGALGAGGANAVQTAPAPAMAVPQKQPAQAADPVNVNPPPPVNVDPPTTPSAPAEKARKARVGQGGAVMDTGVGPHDGYRYRRALEGVRAGTIRPSKDGLFDAVRASPPTARRYIETMAAAGEIVPNPNGSGWVRAPKGGAK